MPSSRKTLECQISQTLWEAIQSHLRARNQTLSQFVEKTIASELTIDQHSMFQVSTSRALVEGVFRGFITVKDLKTHGDFGLGTFDQLDGEMIMLDGICYQVRNGGHVSVVADDATVPFGTVTQFSVDTTHVIPHIRSFEHLLQKLEEFKPSNNLFAGFRIHGRFSSLSMRAICKVADNETLTEAASHQSVFRFNNLTGTMVGFWSPDYSSAISVPGYHFHFVDLDRRIGGHVFDVVGHDLRVDIHRENDIHIALPETEDFLRADLNRDRSGDLQAVETNE